MVCELVAKKFPIVLGAETSSRVKFAGRAEGAGFVAGMIMPLKFCVNGVVVESETAANATYTEAKATSVTMTNMRQRLMSDGLLVFFWLVRLSGSLLWRSNMSVSSKNKSWRSLHLERYTGWDKRFRQGLIKLLPVPSKAGQ